MPSFEISVDFEAFCSVCKGGMCGNVTTRKSHQREADQIVIEPCSCQTDKVKDAEAIAEGMSDRFVELMDKNYDLKQRVKELEKELETERNS